VIYLHAYISTLHEQIFTTGTKFSHIKINKNLYSASHLLFTKFLSARIRSRVNEILRKPRTAIRKDATARCI